MDDKLPLIIEGFDISKKFILNPVIYCKCGCGETLFENNGRSFIRKFIIGHHVRGKFNPMYGISLKGIKFTDQHKKNLSKNKLEFYKTGKNPMYGKKHTKETKEIMSRAWYESDKSHCFGNTKPERFIQSILSINSIEYKLNKNIYGKPDIFIEPNTCVFIDGCFWHGCKTHSTTKQLNHIIPQRKMKRDIIVNKKLKEEGYEVIRIWEHEVYENPMGCLTKIEEYL